MAGIPSCAMLCPRPIPSIALRQGRRSADRAGRSRQSAAGSQGASDREHVRTNSWDIEIELEYCDIYIHTVLIHNIYCIYV